MWFQVKVRGRPVHVAVAGTGANAIEACFPIMRALGYPVVYDVTHSLQLPGGGDGVTAGQAEFIEPMAAAGVAAGVDGVFLEVHERPSEAKSDAQNALALDRLEPLLGRLVRIHAIAAESALAQSH